MKPYTDASVDLPCIEMMSEKGNCWARDGAKHVREGCTYSEGDAHRSKSTKELCGQASTRAKVQSWQACAYQGVMRFGKKEKLCLRYIGPVQVVKQVSPVTYKVELPPSLARIHGEFHVSQLRRCVHDHFF